jgi:hypothetical protein
MVGTMLYMTTGDNAGEGQKISAVNVGTKTLSFESSFSSSIAVGDTYSVSPVPFSLRGWAMQDENVPRFVRWIVSGVSIKARLLSGFSSPNNTWRVGMYRNSGTSIESTTAAPSVDADPRDSTGALSVHGVDLEPYIEQLASGVSFELTDAEFSISLTDSRKDGV